MARRTEGGRFSRRGAGLWLWPGLVGVLVAVSLFSCRDQAPLPPDRFHDLLLEVLFVDEVVERNDSLKALYDAGLLLPYDSLFMAYGCSAALFDSALRYYIAHPKLYDRVLDDLITGMQSRRDSLDQQDSVRGRGEKGLRSTRELKPMEERDFPEDEERDGPQELK